MVNTAEATADTRLAMDMALNSIFRVSNTLGIIPNELMIIPKNTNRDRGFNCGMLKYPAISFENIHNIKYNIILRATLKKNVAEYSLSVFCWRLISAVEKPLSTSTLLNAVNIDKAAIIPKSSGVSIRTVKTPTIRAKTCTPNLSILLHASDFDVFPIDEYKSVVCVKYSATINRRSISETKLILLFQPNHFYLVLPLLSIIVVV